MPKFLTAIIDRGGNEPYSDSNAPASFEMTLAAAPATPPAGEAVLWTVDGKALLMKAPDGTVTTIGPGAGSSPSLGTNFNNQRYGMAVPVSSAAPAANGQYWTPIQIPVATTLTGLWYRKGAGTTAANVIGSLYNAAGTRVAVSGTVAQGTTASAHITLPFSATYAAAAGLYWASLIFSATAGDFQGWVAANFMGPAHYAAQASFAAAASVTLPATTVRTTVSTPMITTY